MDPGEILHNQLLELLAHPPQGRAVGVLIMDAIGYGLDRIARLIENRLVHWSGKDG